MARSIADLATRMTMDSSQAIAEAGQFTSTLGRMSAIGRTALRVGLGRDIVELTQDFQHASDKSEFFTRTVERGSLALAGFGGPLGVAAAGVVQLGLALGGPIDKLEELKKEAAEADQELNRLRETAIQQAVMRVSLSVPTELPDAITRMFDQEPDFSNIDDALANIPAMIAAREGDARRAASDFQLGLNDEMRFAGDMALLSAEGLDTIVKALESAPDRQAAMDAAQTFSEDLALAFAIDKQLEGAMAMAKDVIAMDSSKDVAMVASWRESGSRAAAAWNAGFAGTFRPPFLTSYSPENPTGEPGFESNRNYRAYREFLLKTGKRSGTAGIP